MIEQRERALVLVGSYRASDGSGGGITSWALQTGPDVAAVQLAKVQTPEEAGYLALAPRAAMVYAVDERKNDGRGPVGPAAAVHALRLDANSGDLKHVSMVPTVGPFPTYLCVSTDGRRLYSANHGSFEHVEHVKRTPDGGWETEYIYDDSTVVTYNIGDDGAIERIDDVVVLEGHGADPNHSLQAGGHGQSSAHAHSVTLDPTGQYLLVGDKGTDHIIVYPVGDSLRQSHVVATGPETGPRHVAFDPATMRAFVTYEFSSELAVFSFDPGTGEMGLLGKCSTTNGPVSRTNEPADVRVHPEGHTVYVNNRGQDTLAWFHIESDGTPRWAGSLPLAPSVHPGLAARSIAIDPSGQFLLVTDRPAARVRHYLLDGATGAPTEAGGFDVPEPAFVLVVPPTDSSAK